MNGDTLDDSGLRTSRCPNCDKTVTPRQWYHCPAGDQCPQNWPPGRTETVIPIRTPEELAALIAPTIETVEHEPGTLPVLPPIGTFKQDAGVFDQFLPPPAPAP